MNRNQWWGDEEEPIFLRQRMERKLHSSKKSFNQSNYLYITLIIFDVIVLYVMVIMLLDVDFESSTLLVSQVSERNAQENLRF